MKGMGWNGADDLYICIYIYLSSLFKDTMEFVVGLGILLLQAVDNFWVVIVGKSPVSLYYSRVMCFDVVIMQ